MIKRNLTISFQKSVGNSTSKPEVVEVVVIPLSSPSSSQDNVTLAGGRQVQKVTLVQPVTDVVFELVPTDAPGLSERILYRVGWRVQFLGRVETYDIVMPDFDVHFDDLEELSAIIGGETYLQQSDLGVASRVAKLDDDGDVVNAIGVKITGTGDAVAVDNRLDNEIIARQQADNQVRTTLEQELATQIQSVLDTAQTKLTLAVGVLEGADLTEKTQRINAVNALNSALSTLETETNSQLQELFDTTVSHTSTLLTKADLVNGKVPSSQLPSISLTTAIAVADEAGMLALTTTQVQPGDLAVRPDGSWMLLQNPPSTLGNWIKTSTGGEVLSVNGHIGAVVLAASDVGARSNSTPVPSADVSGLDTFKTNTNSTLTSHGNRISAIENDTLIVRLNNDGVIETELLSDEVAYINVDGELVKKDGSHIVVSGSGNVDSVNGKTGIVVLVPSDIGARSASEPVPASDIEGLGGVLGDIVFDDDPRLSDHRDPNPHKLSHSLGGTDVLSPSDIGARALSDSLDINEVTGLDTILTGHGNRLNSVEDRVGNLEDGVPPNTANSRKAARFDAPAATGDFTTVSVDSPFGYNPTNPNANVDGFYYDPSGAADGEGVWPYITANGHLELRLWNESNPADPVFAHQVDLDALTTVVNGKVDTTTYNTLVTTVDGKADTTTVNAISDAVALKANQSALDATNTAVDARALQTSLDATNTAVAARALQSALDTTNSNVALRATIVDLTAATGRITVVENTLPNKADLVTGRVPLSQTAQNIPQSYIQNLTTDLAAKADLIGGKVPNSQLPALATVETVAVANRAAMLALTTAQVQVGDQCIITATVDKGTYSLVASDPSLFTNWMKHQQPDDLVSSVNGQTGTVVLGPSDVGARSSTVLIPMSDVNDLNAAMALKADLSTTTTALAGKTSPSDVNSLISASTICKQLVGRVATTNVASLSGQQSIDGSLTPLGTIVLLTAQTSSINNGIYQVNSGAWTRVSDMDTGQYLVKGTLALVTDGNTHANEFWQETAASGVVGTNANNWVFAMKAGPPIAYTEGNGIDITGTTISLSVVTGGGLIATGAGAAIDTNLVTRKYTGAIAAGVNPATVTHNLGTQDVQVSVRDIASGQFVLVPATATGLNTVSIDFSSAPTSGQYQVIVQG